MQSLRIAFRNVSRQRKRSLLLAGAIAFGFFVFTLVNGFTGGLLRTVETNLASVLGGHIYLTGTEVSARGSEIQVIRDTASVQSALAAIEAGVASSNPRTSANASVVFGSREESQFLVGVDVAREPELLANLEFVEGDPETFLADPDAVLLPPDTLAKLGLQVGEEVIVKTSTINGQLNLGDFVIAGAVQSQGVFGIATGYAHMAALNAVLGMEPDQYQTFNIYLADLGDLETATDVLYAELAARAEVVPRDEGNEPDFARAFGLAGLTSVAEEERWSGTRFGVTNLDDNLEGFMALVNVMEGISLGIFLVILGIIMVGVMNSYRMVMIERTAEIGTMRAMGLQRTGIRDIFIWEAFFIAFGGALAGLVAALLAIGGVGLLQFGVSDFSFFLDEGRLRFAVSPLEILGTLALLCAMSVAAVYLPARAAANLKPAEALRATY